MPVRTHSGSGMNNGIWEHSGLAAPYVCVRMVSDPQDLEEYIGESWLALGDPWKQVQILWGHFECVGHQ